MRLQNTSQTYGNISRGLHWLMALGLIFMLGLGWRIANMVPSLSNLWLYGLHKSIGFCLLILVLLRLIWHRFSPPPPAISTNVPNWQLWLSSWVHFVMYLLMLAIPLTGLLASSATGISTVLFGSIALPPLTPVSERWESVLFAAHNVLTKTFIGLVVLHIAGAVQRHFIKRDQTLRRMIGR